MSGVMLADLACKIPGFLSPDTCDNLIQYFEDKHDPKNPNTEISTNTYTGETQSSTYRTVVPEEKSPEHTACLDVFSKSVSVWLEYLAKFSIVDTSELFWMVSKVWQYRIMRYSVGDFIHPHTDTGDVGTAPLIRASCTVNLSSKDDYEGGDFYLLNDSVKVELDKGDVLIFPASPFWVHRVAEVTSGTRYSVNAFLGTDPRPEKPCEESKSDA